MPGSFSRGGLRLLGVLLEIPPSLFCFFGEVGSGCKQCVAPFPLFILITMWYPTFSLPSHTKSGEGAVSREMAVPQPMTGWMTWLLYSARTGTGMT